MFCSECGSRLENAPKFCTNCGARTATKESTIHETSGILDLNSQQTAELERKPNIIDIPFRPEGLHGGNSSPSFAFENVLSEFNSRNGENWFQGDRTSGLVSVLTLARDPDFDGFEVDPNFIVEDFSKSFVPTESIFLHYTQVSISTNPKFLNIIELLASSEFDVIEMEPNEYWSDTCDAYAVPVKLADSSHSAIIFLEAWENKKTKDQSLFVCISLVSSSRRSQSRNDDLLPSAYVTLPLLLERIMFSAEKHGSLFAEDRENRIIAFSFDSKIQPLNIFIDARSNFEDTNVSESDNEYHFTNHIVPEVHRVGYFLSEEQFLAPSLLQSLFRVLVHALNTVSDAYSNSPHIEDEDELNFQGRAICVRKFKDSFPAWADPLYLPSHYWRDASLFTEKKFNEIDSKLDIAFNENDENSCEEGLGDLLTLVYDGVGKTAFYTRALLFGFDRYVEVFGESIMNEELMDDMITLSEYCVRELDLRSNFLIYLVLSKNLNHLERYEEAAHFSSVALETLTSWLAEKPVGISPEESVLELLDRFKKAARWRVDATLTLCSALDSMGKLKKAKKDIEIAISLAEGEDLDDWIEVLEDFQKQI